MKKLLTISLVTLAMVLLIVSCRAENNTVEDELAVISFDAAENAARSLTRTNPSFNASELYWYYTAEKKDSTGLTTGQTGTSGALTKTALNSNNTAVNKGLKPVGPFSYGDWEFVLYGCPEADSTKVAYEGKANITINKATTALKVFVTAQTSGSGTLEFPLKSAVIKLGDATGSAATLGTGVVERITFDRLDNSDTSKDSVKYDYSTVSTSDSTKRSISLESGSYCVTFSYLTNYTVGEATEASEYDYTDAYAVAEETIYVSIKDNQVTTIGGDITENTGEVIPTAVDAEAKIVTSEATTYYQSFSEAVNAATAADTVTLLNSVTLSSSETISKNLTVDLGGKILTLASGVDLTIGSSSVTEDNAITVSIRNGIIDGEGYLVNDNYYASLTLENVTFDASRKSIWSGSRIADGSGLGAWFTTSLDGSLATWSSDATNKTNAATYKNWFKEKFIDTGKASYEESESKDEVFLTVYNADLFASYDLIYEYLSLVGYEYWSQLKTANIIIDADLDLGNMEWTPISNQPGKAVLDFRNHTISNLKITNTTETEGSHGTGLFTLLNAVTVKNLVITNAVVSDAKGDSVGILTAATSASSSVQNVTVKNSSVSGYKYVGSIVGMWTSSGKLSDCEVDAVTVKAAYEQVGGIVGYIKMGTLENCKVQNSTVEATTGTDKDVPNNVGGIAGRTKADEGNLTVSNNTVSNTTVKAGSVTAAGAIGYSGNNWVGYISGGEYVNTGDTYIDSFDGLDPANKSKTIKITADNAWTGIATV